MARDWRILREWVVHRGIRAAFIFLTSANIASLPDVECRHDPEYAWFKGIHTTTGASGAVLDSDQFHVVESGKDGFIFVVTNVLVISVESHGLYRKSIIPGDTVSILQKYPCGICDPNLLRKHGYTAPFSSSGQTFWFSAHLPGNSQFDRAIEKSGIKFDIVVDQPCDVTKDKQRKDFGDLSETLGEPSSLTIRAPTCPKGEVPPQ